MKKLFILPFLFIMTEGYAAQLQNFDEVNARVISGKSIRIAIDFLQCTGSTSSPKLEMLNQFNIGLFTPNEIVVNNKGQIATSMMHFTLNNPTHPSKSVFEFVRYTLTSDDNVNVIAQVLDATNYTLLGNKITLNCQMNTAAKIYG